MRAILILLASLCLAALIGVATAQVPTTHAGLPAPPWSGGGGPIAFVAAGDLTDNGGLTSSLSGSYSVSTGMNEGLVVCISGDTLGGADDITSVTYNSISATLLTKYSGAGFTGGDRYQYIYFIPLGNTSAGSHTATITASSTHYILSVVGEYSKIQQTTAADATVNRSVAGSNDTIPITTSTSGDWVMLCEQSNVLSSAGSGDVLRIATNTFGNPTLYDSNGTVPVGANNFGINAAGGTSILTAAAALKPG
jgi:hypothetical protein